MAFFDEFLTQPIDPAPIILFRIGIGLILFFKTIGTYRQQFQYYTSSKYYYFYEFLPFVRPLGKWGTHALLVSQTILSLTLAMGIGHPWSAWALCAVYGYLFFSDKALYRNHYYLFFLLLFLLAYTDSATLAPTIPAWQLYLFQGQFFFVFFYGAMNKSHGEWLLEAMPMKKWFQDFEGRTHWEWRLYRYCFNPCIARRVEGLFRQAWAPHLWCWGGFLTDLLVIPLLLFPPTRPIGLIVFLSFHLFNQWFFNIGTFPYINYAAIFLFLEPGTGRQVLDCLGGMLP